jgi:hypothetical protein
MSNLNNSPASNHEDATFVIEPLSYTATVGGKLGRFTDMEWVTTLKPNGSPRQDLIITEELEELDANGKPITVSQSFNFLPRGRGRSEFKKQMESYFGTPLTPAQLAGFSKSTIVGKAVIVNYNENHLGHVIFDSYLPVRQAEMEAK